MPDKPTAIHARCEQPLIDAVDNWRRQQPQIPPRSKAICVLIKRALQAEEQAAA
jgi:hypothetical protein